MSFRMKGLPAEEFSHLFAMSDEELAKHGAVRRIADGRNPGYPCRVSLADSKPGDELILVNYEHLPVDSPYRMRFAIFVRKGDETYNEVDDVPDQLRKRTLAVRAFDAKGMMTGFELVAEAIWNRQSGSCSARPPPNTCMSISRRPDVTPRAWRGLKHECPLCLLLALIARSLRCSDSARIGVDSRRADEVHGTAKC